MYDLFLKLKSENNQEFCQALETFINNYASVTKFEFLDRENFRNEIWDAIFQHLKNQDQQTVHEKCLATLRILSRDSTNLNNILTENKLNVILEFAGLNTKQEIYVVSPVTCEAQKLLCNILFHSSKIQNLITKTNCLKCVVDRISKYDQNAEHDFKLFDVKIILLITSLNASTRNIVSNELNGDILLIHMLEDVTQNFCEEEIEIKDNDATLAIEILKALFSSLHQSKDPSPEKSERYKDLVIIMRKLLLSDNKKYKESLISQNINLLTLIPTYCYSKLIIPLSTNKKDIIEYQAMDVTVLNVLITFLNSKLECKTNFVENISSVLTAFIKMCRTEKGIRKYMRMEILPPLKDVTKRPEEGTTLRNKLCQLLTSPVTNIKILVAEFLFVLCKEKVGRMIKYTGYGNAAGMLAIKGLMGPEHAKVDYSSESEGSETEEYERVKDRINPVTGCYESPKKNLLDGMTEEQKEYEAMKVVNLVDQLQREGVIQPCRVGEDGKPKPIEHVLELEEHLPRQQVRKQDSDSD